MTSIITGTAAALTLALGLAVVGTPSASAQGAAGGGVHLEKTDGLYTQVRGRSGGRHFHGGGYRHRGGGGRYIAGGIAAGIAGALLYNGYNSYYGPGYYSSPRFSCGELDYRCSRGEGWACRRFDARC